MSDWDPNEPKWSIRRIAREFKVPYATLYKRITGEVEGTEHASGGKGRSRILSKKVEGKPNQYVFALVISFTKSESVHDSVFYLQISWKK